MTNNFVWLDGKIIEKSQAKISALSPSANFGLNVFEGIRCYKAFNNKEINIFRLEDHVARLQMSSKIMCIENNVNESIILDAIVSLINANNISQDSYVRIVLLVDDEGSWHQSGPSKMLVTSIPRPRHDIDNLPHYTANVSSWTRIEDNMMPPRVKAGANYINSRYGFLQAKKDGYDLPIFLDRNGKVTESSGSCLFIIRDGTLFTPPLSSSVLESITRSCIFNLAEDLNLPLIERNIDRTELYISDEVFLCGSAVEISPIVSIDQYSIADGLPGSLSCLLLQKYLETVSNPDQKYSKWVKSVSIL